MDGNTVKIGLLWLVSSFYFIKAISRFLDIKFSNAWISVFVTYVAIVFHYLYIGTSITSSTNEILICGAALLALVACAGSALDLASFLKPAVTLFGAVATVFLLINLLLALTGNQDAFIDGNFVGITANSNMLAGYLALCCFPLFLQSAITLDSRRLRRIASVLLVVCCYLILLSRSRAALLSICASSTFVLMTTKRLRRGGKLLILFTIATATLVAFMQASEKYGEVELLSTRSILLFQRLTAISEHPWLGWGFNSSVYNYYDESNIFPAMEKGNTILQVFEEFGIPFGSVVIIGLFYLIWQAAKTLRQWRYGLAFSATLIGSAVHLMFETWLFNFPALLSIYFWIILLVAGQKQFLTAPSTS